MVNVHLDKETIDKAFAEFKEVCVLSLIYLCVIKDILNSKLESLILNFGEKVEILEPEGVREKIFGRVKKLREVY